MPEGIILSSGSIGATEEDLKDVLARHGYEQEDKSGEAKAPKPAPQAKESEDAAPLSYKEALGRYNAAREKFRVEHPDWDSLLEQNGHLAISNDVLQSVIHHGNPEITYYLAKHPKYVEKLSKMASVQAVSEIGRLAERLAPPEGVTRKGSTTIHSFSTGRPTPVRRAAPPEPKTIQEAAERHDYQAFKHLRRRSRFA